MTFPSYAGWINRSSNTKSLSVSVLIISSSVTVSRQKDFSYLHPYSPTLLLSLKNKILNSTSNSSNGWSTTVNHLTLRFRKKVSIFPLSEMNWCNMKRGGKVLSKYWKSWNQSSAVVQSCSFQVSFMTNFRRRSRKHLSVPSTIVYCSPRSRLSIRFTSCADFWQVSLRLMNIRSKILRTGKQYSTSYWPLQRLCLS